MPTGRGLLRPRPHAHGRLVRHGVGPGVVRREADLARRRCCAGRATGWSSACGARPTRRRRPRWTRSAEVLKGTSGRDLERLGPQVLAGVLPRIYPEMLERGPLAPGRGPPDVHRQRRRQRPGRAWSRGCSAWRAASAPATSSTATGCFTGALDGPFMYGEGKLEGMRGLRRVARHRPRASPGPTRTRPRTCRCCARSANAVVVNPDARAAGGRARRGLAGDAVREARPPPGDRGRDPDRGGSRRRLGPARAPPRSGAGAAWAQPPALN